MTDISLENYYYAKQIRSYIIQFMAIFSGLKVAIGKNDFNSQTNLISVPIIYGTMDRVVAAIKTENTQNKPIRVPIMAAKEISIDQAPELRHGVGTTIKHVSLPLGESLPNGLRVIEKYMPIPYKLNMELSVIVSNTDQKFQIMEQILMLFDPSVQIQTSDAYQDWTKLTTVTMESGVNFEENNPPGTERRLLTSVIAFSMPIYISPPVNLRSDIIKKIRLRIDTAMQSENVYEVAYENSQDLDGYETIIDADTMDIPEK